jgi:hypothetical protein
MAGRVAIAVLAAAAAAVVWQSMPDIRRYLAMRRM